MLICKVCEIGRVLQGYWLCEACRSFLRRNRGNPKISCVTGLHQCLQSIDNSNNNKKGNQKSKHRKLCKGCRLDKCLQMESTTAVNSEIGVVDSNHNTLDLDLSPFLIEIVNASGHFQQNLHQFRYRNEIVDLSQIPNGCVVLQMYLDSLRDQISMMKQFAKGFPVFSDMNLHDRVAFFCSTQFRAIVGEGLINDDDFHFGCFSGQNWMILRPLFTLPYAEMFDSISSQSHRIWLMIRAFNWSMEEKYFFLVFLFFYRKPPPRL